MTQLSMGKATGIDQVLHKLVSRLQLQLRRHAFSSNCFFADCQSKPADLPF